MTPYTSSRGLAARPRRGFRRLGLGRALGLAALLACVLVASASAALIEGDEGDNRLIGTNGDDTIKGWGGNDYIGARAGFDRLYGGSGKDEMYGGEDADELFGSSYADDLFAGCNGDCDAGHDNVLWGGDGPDSLAAENGRADYLDGGTGWDICWVDGLDFYTRCEDVR